MQAEVSLLALELVATPGRAGAMSTGAAITDPLFWMIHPIFEKAWQLLRLAPRYAHYDMTWRNGSCYGSSLHDHQAFTGVLGGEPGSRAIAQFLKMSRCMDLVEAAEARDGGLYVPEEIPAL